MPISPEKIEEIRALLAKAGIRGDELREEFIRGGGSGGQKINKTSSCVRIVHMPTGMAVRCQRTRSLEANRWIAREALAEKLLEAARSSESARIQEMERIRRQKRRRSRRQKARMLEDKRRNSEKKAARAKVRCGED